MAKQPEVRYINYYVSGNIAYQPEKTHSHKQKVQLPRMPKEKSKQVSFDATAVCCIALAAVLMVMLAFSALQLLNAKEETAVLQSYIGTLQTENETLQDTYNAGFDLEQIRGIAQELGMIPIDQAQHMTVQVQLPVQEQEPTVWQSIWTFITGLFA